MTGDATHETVEQVLARYRDLVLPSHREEPLSMSLRDPRPGDQIDAALAGARIELTGTFREFLRHADGMEFFGVTILGAGPPEGDAPSIFHYPTMLQYQLVPIHDWGNGDFDCVDLTKAVEGEAPIVFWDDQRDTTVMITHGFGKWLGMVVEDVQRYGKLLHPDDYRTPEFTGATGVYESPANIRQAFFGEPEVELPNPAAPSSEPDAAPRSGRRSRLRSWVSRRLKRR